MNSRTFVLRSHCRLDYETCPLDYEPAAWTMNTVTWTTDSLQPVSTIALIFVHKSTLQLKTSRANADQTTSTTHCSQSLNTS